MCVCVCVCVCCGCELSPRIALRWGSHCCSCHPAHPSLPRCFPYPGTLRPAHCPGLCVSVFCMCPGEHNAAGYRVYCGPNAHAPCIDEDNASTCLWCEQEPERSEDHATNDKASQEAALAAALSPAGTWCGRIYLVVLHGMEVLNKEVEECCMAVSCDPCSPLEEACVLCCVPVVPLYGCIVCQVHGTADGRGAGLASAVSTWLATDHMHGVPPRCDDGSARAHPPSNHHATACNWQGHRLG